MNPSVNYVWVFMYFAFSVWESEEWLKQHAKPLAQSGGTWIVLFMHLLDYTIRHQGRLSERKGVDRMTSKTTMLGGERMSRRMWSWINEGSEKVSSQY